MNLFPILLHKVIPIVFWIFSLAGFSQLSSAVHIDGIFQEEKTFKDTLDLNDFLNAQKVKWVNSGYPFSGLDSMFVADSIVQIYLHKGEKSKIEIEGLRKKNNYRSMIRLLETYTNSGFPFASLQLDISQKQDELAKYILVVEKGPEIKYDSVFFLKKLKTNHAYIYKLLDISPSDLFKESSYLTIKNKIDRVSFLTLGKPTDISFSNNKAKIHLDIEEQITNRFEGVLGLQQNASGSSSIVGSLGFHSQNLFRSGHELNFDWESFAQASQQLNLSYKHAFLLNARFSPSFRFGLLKQDTTFLTRTTGLGMNTFIGSKTSFLFEYEASSGSIIASDFEEIALENLADYQRNFYQIGASQGNFNALFLLQEGIAWQVSVGVGTKEIKRNLAFPDSYYDTIALKTNFFRLQGRGAYQLKLSKRQRLFQDVHIGVMDNEEILENELFRIGGFSTLRGFNEKNFFAKSYVLNRLEFRSFFESESYIYAFYDQLLYQRAQKKEYPAGIGIGFALDTSSGQFSFAIASGTGESQSFSFAELRAHFGFITHF